MNEKFNENETALLREIAHSYSLPGYPHSLRERGSSLLERVAAELDAQRESDTIPAAVGRRAMERLEYISRRLQMDIDDGSRPDQWSMEDLVRTAAQSITELQQALGEKKDG